jgi:hypothetical protein
VRGDSHATLSLTTRQSQFRGQVLPSSQETSQDELPQRSPIPTPPPSIIIPSLTYSQLLSPSCSYCPMILLTTNPKVSTPSVRRKGPTLLKLAQLDGTTNINVDNSRSLLDSTISRALIATATSCPSPNASPDLVNRDEDAFVSSPPTVQTRVRTDQNTDCRCRYQETLDCILPIAAGENCADGYHSCTTQQIDRRIPKLESELEKKIMPVGAMPSSRSQSTAIRTNHQHQRRRQDSPRREKLVRFDWVHIREHSITVGDHDCGSGTISVSLDWPHTLSSRSIALEDYESIRERQGRLPRGRLRKLQDWHRKQLLFSVGCTTEDDLKLVGCRQQ